MKTTSTFALIAAVVSLTSFSSFTHFAQAGGLLAVKSAVIKSIAISLPIEPVQGNQLDYVPPNRKPANQQLVNEVAIPAIAPRPVYKGVTGGPAQPKPSAPETENPYSSAPKVLAEPPAPTPEQLRQQAEDCIAALPALDLSGLTTKKARNKAARKFAKAHFKAVNGCLVAQGLSPLDPPSKKPGGIAGKSASPDEDSSGSAVAADDSTSSGSSSAE